MSAETAETIGAAELRAAIEGIYTMAVWYDGTEAVHAPEADGRWVLVDGVFVSLLLKREPDGSKQTIAMMGGYAIEDGAFTYGYDDGSYLIQRPDGSVDAPRVPFGERRRFEAVRDGSIIRLVWNDGAAEFRIGGEMIDYLEHGVVQRRWERVRQGC
jgi:hypothetical protein